MRQKTDKKEILFNEANSDLKIGIVTSMYYSKLTKNMEKSCVDCLIKAGVKKSNINVFSTPGSWEVPIIAKNLARSKIYDGLVAFGVIIKGDTHHFEIIAQNSSSALMRISLDFNIPIALGILTAYNLEQAQKRALGKNNKGIECAVALLSIIYSLKNIK